MAGKGEKRLLALAGALCVLALAASPQPARASLGFQSVSFAPSTTQAGGHPDLAFDVALEDPQQVGPARQLTLNWPVGLNLLAGAVASCESADLIARECPVTSQLGVATVREAGDEDELVLGTVPVFSVAAGPDSPARVGFVIPIVDDPVFGTFDLRDGSDYGTRLELGEFPEGAPLAGLELELWGVPAAASHDGDRFPDGSEGCVGETDTGCITTPTASNLPPEPLTESPTSCAGALSATALLESHEGQLYSADMEYAPSVGCGRLSFDPVFDLALSTTEVRSPTGLDLDLQVPQFPDTATPSPSELRGGQLHFEDGVWLGFGPEAMPACGDAEAELATEEAAHCQAGAKLGTVELDAATLPGPVSGELFYRGEAPTGAYLGLLAASGYGVDFKLSFSLQEDPETGMAIVALRDLPQIPISEIAMHFSDGAEAFETVNECGAFAANLEFQPWDAVLPNQLSSTDFTLDSGPQGTLCPGPATHVDVSLSPASIPAASRSTTTATARITDGNRGPAVFDLVEFRSSDPGEQIGPVDEIEDGVYTARISSPTVAGDVTITAVDRSVEPNVSGTATLHQVPLQGGPAPGRLIPSVRITKHPPRRTHRRRPVFAFESNVPRSTFRCSVDSSRFHRCRSPLRLPRLRPGKHRFRVFTVTPAGEKTNPASFRFRVLGHRHGGHRHHHRLR